jgi:hypothetical protein
MLMRRLKTNYSSSLGCIDWKMETMDLAPSRKVSSQTIVLAAITRIEMEGVEALSKYAQPGTPPWCGGHVALSLFQIERRITRCGC